MLQMHSSPATVQPVQTFRSFVTAPQNAVAYNAALSVAIQGGTCYNPLILTGPTGCGKTHLLQAIALHMRRHNEGEVILITADNFAADFAAHMARGLMGTFRRRYRRAAALLIDDLQLIGGRDAAAEELALTIDALRIAERQIVVTCDQRPSLLQTLPTRLVSRVAGALAQVGIPDEAGRLIILQNKVAIMGIEQRISQEALRLLAAQIQGSVGELEMALDRLLVATPLGRQASAGLAARIATDCSPAARPQREAVRVEEVLMAVCDYYSLSTHTLLEPGRGSMLISQARQVTMYLLRDLGLTTLQIGRELGRDHSTVIHGCNKIAQVNAQAGSGMSEILEAIRQAIQSESSPRLRLHTAVS